MNYKTYWDSKQHLQNWLNAVEELKNTNHFKFISIEITAKVYKDYWGIPLNEARALALATD